VPQDARLLIDEGDAEVADGAGRAQIRIARIERDDVVRHVYGVRLADDRLAGSAGDVVLVVADPLAPEPEGEGT
jgi:hypothetical protein